jgi:protein O-mannosyl-transferase
MARIRDALPYTVLLALTFVAYLPVWSNGFVDFDDEIYITTNPPVAEGLTPTGSWWAWTNDDAPYWTPLTWLSLQLDASCSLAWSPPGEAILSPAIFHGQNLAWHSASVLLLFRLWRRLSGQRGRSFLVAALFAVHPMHVESVAWAIERKDVLSGFFGILTLSAYARWAANPGWKPYLTMTAAFLLSLLSKPTLITLPFVLLLLDYWPLRRWGFSQFAPATATGSVYRRTPFGGLLREKTPMFALAAVIACITMAARDRHGSLVSLSDISLSDRLANALAAYGWYVFSTFWPTPLAALYPHPHNDWSPPRVVAGAACLLCVTAFSLRQARRQPWLVVGWLWFVGTLAPVIGLAQGGAQAWADRFSYWPHIGLFVAVVWEVESFVDRLAMPFRVPRAAWGLVLGGLTALTWLQVAYWHDSLALWEHVVAVTKDNDRAHQYLSRCYRAQGRRDEADWQLEEAARIQAKRRRHPP